MQRRGTSLGPLLPLSMVGLLGVAGCVGIIGDLGGSPLEEQVESEVAVSGLRRLTAQEYATTVEDLVGFVPNNVRETLPVDPLLPFDNDFTFQKASEALIQGADLLAGDVAEGVLANTALRDKLVGCTPSGTMDATCFRSFIKTFGRKAFRRPLTTAEIDNFAAFLAHASVSGDFYTAVDSAIRAFLQHPAFLYRVEIGTPVPGSPGVNKLNDYEVATRLSYLIIGSTPEDWLLDDIAAGKLATPEGIRATAEKLFGQDRAQARMSRFHELWLGYSTLSNTGVSADMRTETDALISRIIFEDKRPWTDMLTSSETYVTPELATHYGLPSPGAGAGWVSYGDTGRKGILSQGTFLSAVSKFGDTSPTQRGLLVRTRLFCQIIPKPPPELMVNVDMPPNAGDPNACKSERYFMSTTAGCKNCHALMDPVGFGLERYDAAGRYRETEPNRPDCPINGAGVLDGVGNFNGPAELADLMLKAGGVDQCVAEQLYRYGAGRTELDSHDQALLDRLLVNASSQGGLRLDQFILDFVTSDAIRYRREETVK